MRRYCINEMLGHSDAFPFLKKAFNALNYMRLLEVEQMVFMHVALLKT